ncbi:iron-containing redox enzyme family protein [Micromonospora sp. DT81.3]|uniref:iron-containing redox enzyme family protein n=1 Tax=Actinomycetes TaxID=1760 RepID=UPI003CED1A6F
MSVFTPTPSRSSHVFLPYGPRGPLSRELHAVLGASADTPGPSDLMELALDAVARASDVARDGDIQVTLLTLYGLHYGSFDQFGGDWEWHPGLIRTRAVLERAFEAQLRAEVPSPALPDPSVDAVARFLFTLTGAQGGPSLARFIAKSATSEQLRELLIQRSIYTLREADPHSWAIPRLTGRAKAALVEIQSDEYGGGVPSRMHSAIFAQTMRALALDDTYGAYVDAVPAVTLASLNMMSMFGLNRRLRGAIVGHLAAFEMTSSIPNRFYGDGFRRHGFDVDATEYFDEHVEADAVHEQIAGRDLAGALAEDEPVLLPDIVFGAAACLAVDGWVGEHILDAWRRGDSSLRQPVPEAGGATT